MCEDLFRGIVKYNFYDNRDASESNASVTLMGVNYISLWTFVLRNHHKAYSSLNLAK